MSDMTDEHKRFIGYCIASIVQQVREQEPRITPGEVYDEITKYVEQRLSTFTAGSGPKIG